MKIGFWKSSHIYKILSSDSVPKLRNALLTLNIKTLTISDKITQTSQY